MTARPHSSLLSVVAAAALSLGTVAMVFQSVGAIGLFPALLARTAVQTIGIRAQERQDRTAVNAKRDRLLADAAAEEAGLAIQLERGWRTAEEVERERARLAELRKAINEVALRERQIVSYQARRRIDAKLRNTFRDAISAATGVDRRAADFMTSLFRGENPLQAAIAAATSEGGTDPRQGFRDLRDRLREVQKAASAVTGVRTVEIRQRLAEALRQTIGLAEGDGLPPDDQITRLRELSEALGKASAELGSITEELFPASPGIARERFQHDERWVVWNANVDYLDSTDAKQAVISSVLRRSTDRVIDIMARQGITLTEDQITAIAGDVAGDWVDWRREEGLASGVPFDMDQAVRDAINDVREGFGLDGLPEPDEADGAAQVYDGPPVKRRFRGTGTITYSYFERDDAQCEITFSVDVDMSLAVDGIGGVFTSDSPQTAGTTEGVDCFAQGKPRLYGGPWTTDGVTTTLAAAYGIAGDVLVVTVTGLPGEGTATSNTPVPDRGGFATYLLEFTLAEDP